MNGAIHTPAAQQGVIGGVDDRINPQGGDIRQTGGQIGHCFSKNGHNAQTGCVAMFHAPH